ncbi:MAG: hypothetical protein EZS28_027898 [Streblomastix strix]|uniref:Uncharacterized protein n=1 Tax=Streblomastix strix TaxID=222440 RepID=A0A5J4V3G6_9EUKA|nr:MAG: hypothetical protein EZS28_027898 [Streblomastix strix]
MTEEASEKEVEYPPIGAPSLYVSGLFRPRMADYEFAHLIEINARDKSIAIEWQNPAVKVACYGGHAAVLQENGNVNFFRTNEAVVDDLNRTTIQTTQTEEEEVENEEGAKTILLQPDTKGEERAFLRTVNAAPDSVGNVRLNFKKVKLGRGKAKAVDIAISPLWFGILYSDFTIAFFHQTGPADIPREVYRETKIKFTKIFSGSVITAIDADKRLYSFDRNVAGFYFMRKERPGESQRAADLLQSTLYQSNEEQSRNPGKQV